MQGFKKQKKLDKNAGGATSQHQISKEKPPPPARQKKKNKNAPKSKP